MSTEKALSPDKRKRYDQIRDDFDKSRSVDKRSACSAPFNNIYLTTVGDAAPCWLQVGHLEKYSGNTGLKSIWNGENFKRLRDNLSKNIFEDACKICKNKIEKDNWPLAMAYDGFSIKEYPSCLELELSNQCNLECVMCEGRLSSGIRKNRDNLPPLPMIYDQRFVDELEEFIPHLEELRFNGGEPFAQKIVHDICNKAIELNPNLKINIATNGTVLNNQVKSLMERCNMHLNISIDSLIPEMYEKIRINGKFEVLMENFKWFNEKIKEKNRNLSVMVNPMRTNWKEMPEFVRFTIKERVFLWYNTIHHPEHLAIWNLSYEELSEIVENLAPEINNIRSVINESDPIEYGNWQKLDHFVNKQVAGWKDKAHETRKN